MSSLIRRANIISKWALLTLTTTTVFITLDMLDSVFCLVFAILDYLIEGNAAFPCCCSSSSSSSSRYSSSISRDADAASVSETLHGGGVRLNMFRMLTSRRRSQSLKEWKRECGNNRWSDCGCEGCMSWINGCLNGCDFRLHVVVQQPHALDKLSATSEDHSSEQSTENVIFLHGFMSSSSFWSEAVFSNLSDEPKNKYKLFAVDLLGFGKSPKPRDCLYTLKDHMEMVEKSVIVPFRLNSFHIVAHSMGSVIAIALAAKYSTSVKTVTLVAPPCFTTSNDALQKLAGKRLWPPMAFGASLMSWYEHLGRIVCFVVCRNHRILESVLRLITWRRDLNFRISDITKHTHHSAWHTMHNVICGGAEFMAEYLEILRESRVKVTVIQGEKDEIVPPECRSIIKKKVPDAEIRVFSKHNHTTIVLNQPKEFTEILQNIWSSCK